MREGASVGAGRREGAGREREDQKGKEKKKGCSCCCYCCTRGRGQAGSEAVCHSISVCLFPLFPCLPAQVPVPTHCLSTVRYRTRSDRDEEPSHRY